MMKNLILLIAIMAGIGTAVGNGIDPGVFVKGGVDEKLNTEPRPGVEVNEMNLQSIDSTIITPAIANKMNAVGTGAGLYNGNWISFANLFAIVGVPAAAQANFQKWFVIDAKEDAEVYWADDNNDNAVRDNEMYHRFNMARTDWDTMTLAQILAAPVVADKYDASIVSPPPYNGGGLRWLANYGKDASGNNDESFKGTFPNVAARRSQIAANLLDYCDSNSIPTSDWNGTTATYTGNEKTPYINEIGLEVQADLDIKNAGGGKKTMTITVYARPGVELVNMYGATFSAAASINVKGNIYFTWNSKNNPVDTVENQPFNITWVPTATGASEYKFTWGNQITIFTHFETISPPPVIECKGIKIQITGARLNYNGNFADFAIPDAATEWSNSFAGIFIDANPSSLKSSTVCFSYQANDPRQNLNPDDWGTGTVGAINAAYSTVGTQDVINAGVTCTTAGDTETVSTPTTISTAYIRNAPIQSPWEIGSIHRGAAWETINLKEYNAVAGANPLTSGGLYTESSLGGKNGGDANILDQIKMTANVRGKQKVNLMQSDTSTTSGVLSALFKNIRVGSAYATPGTGGTAITTADVVAIVTDVKAKSSTFKTRACIVNASALRNTSEQIKVGQINDRTKEEIIGKMVNLTAVAPTGYFTVVIIAQSIKDVGPGTFSKDLDLSGSISNPPP